MIVAEVVVYLVCAGVGLMAGVVVMVAHLAGRGDDIVRKARLRWWQ